MFEVVVRRQARAGNAAPLIGNFDTTLTAAYLAALRNTTWCLETFHLLALSELNRRDSL